MTLTDALAEIDLLIDAWQREEITALKEGEAERAHDARIKVAAAQYVKARLIEKATEDAPTCRDLDWRDDVLYRRAISH